MKKKILDFIRNNSILYKKNVLVTTKVRSNRNKYDVYEVLLPPRRVNDATDELYVRTILDMQKELPGTIRGKYVSLEDYKKGKLVPEYITPYQSVEAIKQWYLDNYGWKSNFDIKQLEV